MSSTAAPVTLRGPAKVRGSRISLSNSDKHRQPGPGNREAHALTAAGAAGIKANLRRGFLRFGIGLALLWFVFWTCAYILRPQASENAPSLPPALSLTTVIALIVASILCAPWILSGFRSN